MNHSIPQADPILAKVRKLLAKAEDPAATAQESETYTAKAAQLIADYGIDRALLAAGDPSRDPVGDRVVLLEAPYAVDKAELLDTVAQRLRCKAVHRTTHGERGKELSVHLFGHASDLERTDLLFTSLLMQATTELGRVSAPRHESKAAFRRSWLAGYRIAIGNRLAEAEERAVREAEPRFRSSGTASALVLADRGAEVVTALNAEYPHLRTARARTLSGSGGRAGWDAGQRADLGGGRLGRRGRGILPA